MFRNFDLWFSYEPGFASDEMTCTFPGSFWPSSSMSTFSPLGVTDAVLCNSDRSSFVWGDGFLETTGTLPGPDDL
jgi:hypothetical protein